MASSGIKVLDFKLFIILMSEAGAYIVSIVLPLSK